VLSGAADVPPAALQGRTRSRLTSPEGIPVAIEVFTGNTGDPTTVASQVTKVKDRFVLTRVVLVGDRGMLTAARLREDVRPEGLDWITALRAPTARKLARDGDLQLSLFDVADLAEITSPDFPGERLVACMKPFGEAERARKRESLLAATEADLAKIAAACARARAPLRGHQPEIVQDCQAGEHPRPSGRWTRPARRTRSAGHPVMSVPPRQILPAAGVTSPEQALVTLLLPAPLA
jgi:Transposase DDE domain